MNNPHGWHGCGECKMPWSGWYAVLALVFGVMVMTGVPAP